MADEDSNCCGPLLQVSTACICLVGSGPALYVALGFACSFHLLSIPLLGIVFPFNIPCYMIALLPNSAQHAACLLSFPALITALLLFSSTFLMAEDWPLNGLPLYPYNARQIGKLESLFGRYLLAHSDGKGRESSICLTELCVSACPAICFPGHFKALEAIFASELSGPSSAFVAAGPAARLSAWLRRSRRFVDQRPEGQPGRCFDEVMESTA